MEEEIHDGYKRKSYIRQGQETRKRREAEGERRSEDEEVRVIDVIVVPIAAPNESHGEWHHAVCW